MGCSMRDVESSGALDDDAEALKEGFMASDDLLADLPFQRVREQSLWMGTSECPVFARLTMPASDSACGGVVLSPSIFRDARASRQSLRALAATLADDGFVVVRFDQFGIGDSSGDLNDDAFLEVWKEQVGHAIALLRSMGVESVSAVGFRLGATILAAASIEDSLNLTSVVLWDPCESGRSYVREMNAFETLRRASHDATSTLATSEFVLNEQASESIRSLNLLEATPTQMAPRVLIITRVDRPVSSRMKEHFNDDSVEWAETSEQSNVLEVELPASVLPMVAIRMIGEWIGMRSAPPATLRPPDAAPSVNLGRGEGPLSIRETALTVAQLGLFAIVSEPVEGAKGPWIVMIPGINEDHVGPARSWVNLSRRWASYGLRCVRFDFAGLGESTWPDTTSELEHVRNSQAESIRSVVMALCADDPTNTVFVGLCTGAQKSLESAMSFSSRGVCTINPQVGRSIQRATDRMVAGNAGLFTAVMTRLKKYVERHEWMGEIVWQFARVFFPSAYSLKIRQKLAENGTEMLLIVSPDDFNPFPRVPIVRSLDKRRLISTALCRIEIVPGLDHDFFNIAGRNRAIEILDAYVHEKFVTPTT
jgi:pimeloyl-ACP methyl ester carboxylesterase